MGTLSQEDYIRRVKEQMAEMQEHRQRLTEARERLMKSGLSSRSGGPHATAEETHELPELCISSPPDAPNVANNDSGWAALAKSVREIDENVVKDYKEDIDTILVFVGHAIDPVVSAINFSCRPVYIPRSSQDYWPSRLMGCNRIRMLS